MEEERYIHTHSIRFQIQITCILIPYDISTHVPKRKLFGTNVFFLLFKYDIIHIIYLSIYFIQLKINSKHINLLYS